MFAASPSFPPLLSLQYRFISMFDNCILCCSSRVPFQLRCPFKPTFRRDRKEVLFPSRDSSPRDIYTFSPLLLLFSFFFFLYRKEITFRDEFIHESRDIEDIFFPFFFVPSRKRKNEEKPSLKNSENLEIKPYKKKIAFSLLLSTMLKREEDVWVKQGEASCWKILIIHRLASIMKPSWSDGRRNTNCPLCPPTFKTCSRRRRRACWFPFHSASCSRARDR